MDTARETQWGASSAIAGILVAGLIASVFISDYFYR